MKPGWVSFKVSIKIARTHHLPSSHHISPFHPLIPRYREGKLREILGAPRENEPVFVIEGAIVGDHHELRRKTRDGIVYPLVMTNITMENDHL